MRSPNTSPSGPAQGLARLSLSEPLALADGIGTPVPFDVADVLSGNLGEVEDPLFASTYCFSFGPGLYLLQAQYKFNEAPATSIQGDLFVAFNGGAVDTRTIEAVNDRLNITLNALVLPGIGHLSGLIYAAVGARLTAEGGAVSCTEASLVISRLAIP